MSNPRCARKVICLSCGSRVDRDDLLICLNCATEICVKCEVNEHCSSCTEHDG